MNGFKKSKKQFKYNLETVLRVRKIREHEAQQKFSLAQQKFLEEKQKEEELKDFQRAKYAELREIMHGKISNFQQVLMRKSHLDILKEEVVEQEKKKQVAEEKKEVEKVKLVDAMRRKKIIQVDKGKKKDNWKKWMVKEENKFLDDISTVRHERQRRNTQEENEA